MSASLTSVGDDWLAVVTILAPALIPLMYAVGLWIVVRKEGLDWPRVNSGDDMRLAIAGGLVWVGIPETCAWTASARAWWCSRSSQVRPAVARGGQRG